MFEVTGFKIKGEDENEQLILIGSKHVNCGGRIELESPPIPLESTSSYKWYNELKTASDDARNEVQLYRNGKCTIEEEEEKVVSHKIDFDMAEGDNHLESGKI